MMQNGRAVHPPQFSLEPAQRPGVADGFMQVLRSRAQCSSRIQTAWVTIPTPPSLLVKRPCERLGSRYAPEAPYLHDPAPCRTPPAGGYLPL